MGLCYLNNVAIAANLLAAKGKKVVILDIDAHCGNGTEDIVKGIKNAMYIGIHTEPWADLYTPLTELGVESYGNIINYPLPLACTETLYLETLKNAIIHIKQYKPDVVLVSAGVDSYIMDKCAMMMLCKQSFMKIGEKIGKLVAELKCKVVLSLEGGYSEDANDCFRLLIKKCMMPEER